MTEHDEEKSTGVGWFPPPKSRHGYDWEVIAAELRSEARQVEVDLRGRQDDGRERHSSGSRQRELLPSDGFEVTTRNNRPATSTENPKTCDLYLRYMKKGKS